MLNKGIGMHNAGLMNDARNLIADRRKMFGR